jgi:hypothetical protein
MVTAGDINAPYRVQPEVPDVTGGPTGLGTSLIDGPVVERTPVPRSHGWLDQKAVLALFATVLLAAVVVAAIVAFAQGEKRDVPPCDPPQGQDWDSPGTLPCAGLVLTVAPSGPLTSDQATGRHPLADRVPYRDEVLGFSLEYDPTIWTVGTQEPGLFVLTAVGGNVVLVFEGAPAGQLSQQQLLDLRANAVGSRLLGFTDDTEPARTLLGDPILGYRDAISRLAGGTLDTGQGPSVDMTFASVVGTDGTTVVGATLLTPVELTIQRGDEELTLPVREIGLQLADSVLNSFTWPADEVPQ